MKHNNIIGKIVTLSLVTLVLSSCYREKPISSNLGDPLYKIEDGSHPADHSIFEIYKNTGIQVIYKFDPKVAEWNLGAMSSFATYISLQNTDAMVKDNIAKNLEYICKDFLDLYPTDFKKKFMPLRIYLCDSIMKNKGVEHVAWYGTDNLAINIYTDGERNYDGKKIKDPITKKKVYPLYNSMEEYYSKATLKLHSMLFTYLSKYRVTWPQSFLTYCQHLYGENLSEDTKTYPNFDPRIYGFWTYDDFNTFKYYRAIKEDKDIADFVDRMIGYTEAENMAAMEGFPELRAKYDILRNFIKETFEIDLQEIGNKKK